jgi:DNA-binding transcriptional LysR family regulator
MDLDANDLLLFARVAESGSFSRAAERVQLPKSTVSRRVAALEKRLGERLLQRSTRKLSITDFGLGVLDHARALALEVEGAQALAQHRQAKPSGRLRVSMPADFATSALPQMLATFVQEHPAIQLELDLSPRRVDLIGENFDMAVRMGDLPDDSQLVARRLSEMTMGLYAVQSYLDAVGEPHQPQDLLDLHGLLLLKRTGDAQSWSLTRGEGADREQWEGSPAKRTLANSPEVLLSMALAGQGVVSVPDFYARMRVGSGALKRVLPGWCLPPQSCWAVFPSRRLMPARTRAFLDALVATMNACTEPSVLT